MASTTTITRPMISNVLIIKALNPPTKPMGRWADRLARDVHRIAVRNAPVNDPLNAIHRSGIVGTYKRSLQWDRRGTNGHFVRRRIYSPVTHAIIVEKGRPSTKGGRWEVFYWNRKPGVKMAVQGTSGRGGYHVLERAFVQAMAGRRRVFPSAIIR